MDNEVSQVRSEICSTIQAYAHAKTEYHKLHSRIEEVAKILHQEVCRKEIRIMPSTSLDRFVYNDTNDCIKVYLNEWRDYAPDEVEYDIPIKIFTLSDNAVRNLALEKLADKLVNEIKYKKQKALREYQERVEAEELAELARLKAKYEQHNHDEVD